MGSISMGSRISYGTYYSYLTDKKENLEALEEYYDKVFNNPVKGSSYFLAGSDLPRDMVEFQNAPQDSFSTDGFIQFL